MHLERFSTPGEIAARVGQPHPDLRRRRACSRIGAGGLDVATAMGGLPFFLDMPKVSRSSFAGKLQPWVASKDMILELLAPTDRQGRRRQDL